MSRKNQERTEAHEEMETRKLRKEAEKTSTRERTVLVSQRGEGRGREGGREGREGLPSLYVPILSSLMNKLLRKSRKQLVLLISIN